MSFGPRILSASALCRGMLYRMSGSLWREGTLAPITNSINSIIDRKSLSVVGGGPRCVDEKRGGVDCQ